MAKQVITLLTDDLDGGEADRTVEFGLDGKTVLDAPNRLGGEAPPSGYSSTAEYVAATTPGPVPGTK